MCVSKTHETHNGGSLTICGSCVLETHIHVRHSFHEALKSVFAIFQVTHLVISRPDDFTFSAGDYVFIQIPDLAAFEWHPFSISSAPEEDGMIFPSFVSGQGNKILKSHLSDSEFKCNILN